MNFSKKKKKPFAETSAKSNEQLVHVCVFTHHTINNLFRFTAAPLHTSLFHVSLFDFVSSAVIHLMAGKNLPAGSVSQLTPS